MGLPGYRIFSLLLGLSLIVGGILAVGGLLFPSFVPWFAVPLWTLVSFVAGLILLGNPIPHPFASLPREFSRIHRALFSTDHSYEMIFWLSRDGLVVDVNDQLVHTLGYSRDELLGSSPALFERQYSLQYASSLWKQGKNLGDRVIDTVFHTKKGELIPVEFHIRFPHNPADQALCVFCRDISRHVKVSRELQSVKEMFELYLEGLPVGVFIRGGDGRFLYFNHQFQRWNPLVRLDSPIEEVFNSQLSATIAKEDLIVLNEGAALFWQESVKENGEKQFFEIHKFPIRIPGQPPMIGGIVMDVTIRRQSEQRLLENQAFLEAVINQSSVGIIILDGNTTNIIICNNGAKEIIGIPQNENLSGKTISFDGLIWEVLNPDGTPPPLEQNPLYKAFFHQTTSNDKMLLRRMDGDDRFVLINSGPIYDAEGSFIAAIVAFLDITELREAQQQLEELNRRLEEIVTDRTRELMESNSALKVTIDNLRRTQEHLIESEKLASLGGLVAGVAHEINTPVGVGVTAASFLREKTLDLEKNYHAGDMRKSDLEGYLINAKQSSGIILSNLERASNLIKSFKLISVDQSTDPRRSFRPKEYFQDLFVSLHPPDKRLHLQIDIQGDPDLTITSYPGAYSQILTNLYMNSCIHGFEGRNEGVLSVEFQLKGKRFHLKYSDNGVGMEEQVVRRIYEPFFTTRRDLGGTGLGMNIVFNLVNQKLGGTIRAFSKVGEGTQFHFDLPADPPASEGDLANIIL